MNILKEYFKFYDINNVIDIKPADLIFDNKVREACEENKCTRFEMNFMCPPNIGSIEKYRTMVNRFDQGLLIYFTQTIEKTDDHEEYYGSADILNDIILASENAALEFGYVDARGFIAGHCRRCDPCGKAVGLVNCIEPNLARPSMEAVGIDVMKTCELKGNPIAFENGKVTWVGLLLIKKE